MGFGPCKVEVRRMRRRPPGAPPLSEKILAERLHCEGFYWSASSAMLKTACLGLFFLVESPRRIAAFISGRLEPKPLLDCSRWGYRICACNHHYYDHASIFEAPPEKIGVLPAVGGATPNFSFDDNQPSNQETTKPKKKRKRFWFF